MTTLTLRSYLDSRRTTSADWNITGMGVGANGWTGKYAIPDDEYDTFLRLAHDHVFRNGRACSLLEKHKSNGPILIDLDFRYPAGGPLHRRFTTEQIREFVAAYADAFARFFEPPSSDPLQFFVMLKPAPEADPAHDQHKDGVHIVCPTITLPPETQYAIRGWLLQTNAIQRVFGTTGMVNEPTDCLDISVIARNNWFLYGACKPDKAWYKVQHVYGVMVPESREDEAGPWITSDHLEEESMEAWDSEELVRLLSIRHGHDETTALSLRTDDPATEAEWAQLLQRWGRGSNWAKPKSPGLMGAKQQGAAEMPQISLSAGAAADDMMQVSGMSVRSGYSTEDIALAYRLVRECLNPEKRCGEYQDWVNMALCLKNIADTDESMAAWADITRRTGPSHKKSRMGDAEIRSKWRLLPAEAAAMQRGRKPLLMGTLHLWAKEDAPASYRAIIGEANREMALLNDSGSHVSVADLTVRMYRHEFRCTPARKGATAASMDWYQFPPDGHTWRSLKTWMRLRERLSNEVRNQYIHADREVGNRITLATTEDERQRLESKRKNLLKVESQLQNTSFKDSVMKEAAEKFYDEEFLQHMNMEPTLVGFSNGILELRSPGSDGRPHTIFRPGRPDDCISFQMGRGIIGMDAIPYIPYDPENPAPEHLELVDFFRKIYPDPVLREYVLTLYSACLEGANHEQKFYIMSGSGGNGKSKIIDLMSKTFGEYQEALPVTALTRKRADAGSANPEMIVLKCKRFVSMVEPEEGERINTSLMKQLSGQDTLKARGLFQDQDSFVVMARIFMSCNDLPAVSSMDDGTWRRLRVIPHVSTFVEEGKPTNPMNHVYSRDPLLDSKIIRWRPYFAGMLAWYFENKYLRGGINEPAQVNEASRKYKEENDAFAAFAQDCLLKEVGAEVRANDVLVRYKEWIRFNPGKKVLNKKDILAKMTEAYGQPIDGGRVYVGVRIAEEGEDVSGNVISGPGFSATTVALVEAH
jgi:P4 family phage/plasmid primase-like protien